MIFLKSSRQAKIDLIVFPILINIFMSLVVDCVYKFLGHGGPSNNNVVQEFINNGALWQLSAFAILVVLFAPAFEEFLFRTALWEFYSRYFKEKVVAHIVAITFALFHLDPYAIFGLLPFSYYLSHIRIKYGSSKATFLAHVIFNLIGVITLLT